MAYKYEDLERQALAAIEKHKLFFIEDLIGYLPCGKTTFYEYKLNEANVLNDALTKNKVSIKVALRSKWYNGNNPLTQMALYKLIGTEDEYHRIASTKTENKNINIERPIFGGIDLDVIENNSSE